MFARRIFCLAALALLACSWGTASAQVGVSVGIGGPWYHHRGYYPYYYGPRVYVGPPVVVAPAPGYYVAPPPPVVVQPAPAVVTYPPSTVVVPPPPR
jgi:hypothetical protein